MLSWLKMWTDLQQRKKLPKSWEKLSKEKKEKSLVKKQGQSNTKVKQEELSWPQYIFLPLATLEKIVVSQEYQIALIGCKFFVPTQQYVSCLRKVFFTSPLWAIVIWDKGA